ncbi:D-alanine--D-alanine ligase family protein [uncultured Bifidobacterium sp.]|uniref:D-alanine--D-alanine ligase family protein n=1 Tax=uncultured Bifidobacterium sp. TaxID=165187 RepID=UPI00258CE4C4|nr:D-alanine--D-alanine ligase family protein [uncultured Bifidobacterium sp.]MEE0653549.1 D-alanine--D-alanine ligase family protein [Bifidobacterium criceti]
MSTPTTTSTTETPETIETTADATPRTRVAVIYGGKADEHSISCITAATFLRAMDASKFEPVLIGITKDGAWITDGDDPLMWDLAHGLPHVERTADARDVVLNIGAGADGFLARDADGSLTSLGHIDIVLPALHGPYGEDGTIQGLFEMMGVPYVGCGVLASAACMDKHYTKVLLAAAGIPVSPGITIDTRRFDAADHFAADGERFLALVDEAGLAYPLFVKPSRAGSSFGVTKVERINDPEALAAAVYEASLHDWRVLIEQGIDAREIECGVIRPKPADLPRASLPGEVVLDKRESGDDQFYDFDSKYMDAQASHTEIPPKLSDDLIERVRDTAVRAFHAVDGMGLSRVDTFVTADGDVLVNEINTLPGCTSISLFPKAWEATGIPFPDMVTLLIEGALSE